MTIVVGIGISSHLQFVSRIWQLDATNSRGRAQTASQHLGTKHIHKLGQRTTLQNTTRRLEKGDVQPFTITLTRCPYKIAGCIDRSQDRNHWLREFGRGIANQPDRKPSPDRGRERQWAGFPFPHSRRDPATSQGFPKWIFQAPWTGLVG